MFFLGKMVRILGFGTVGGFSASWAVFYYLEVSHLELELAPGPISASGGARTPKRPRARSLPQRREKTLFYAEIQGLLNKF